MKKAANRKRPAVNKVYYIYVGILAVLFFIFHTIPFLKGVFYSFTDWRGYGDWNFVGLRNYLHMFVDADTGNAYIFTFKFAVITTILVNVISLVLACALNAKIKFKNTIKAFYFLPYMLGSLIVGFIFNYIFANLIPELGKTLGIEALSVNILGTNSAMWGIIAVSLWIGCAFNTLIYIAGLQSIDTDVYEAADLGGATGFKRFSKITFPLLAPSFTINMVLSAKGYLMVYDQIMAMTDGGPGTATTSIAVLIYKKGFGGGQFAYQSANAVVLFIVVVLISVFQLRVLEKREEVRMKQGVAKVKERYNWPVTILLIIGIVLIILLPLYMALMIAIKDPSDMNNVLALPRKLRLQNFADAWVMTDFPRKFFNTTFITVINLFFTLITNSFAAYAITRNRKKSKFLSVMYYYFISAMFIPFQVIMLPLVVQANAFHLDNIYGITFLYVIFGLPMNTFLYTGAIKAIPEALDEAAMIDGANPIQIFSRVIFPVLKPTTATVAILSFMWTWNDFSMPLVLLSDESQQTLQLAQYVFKSQFSVDYNLAFASYLLVLAPVLIVYIFCQKWIMNGVVAGAVK